MKLLQRLRPSQRTTLCIVQPSRTLASSTRPPAYMGACKDVEQVGMYHIYMVTWSEATRGLPGAIGAWRRRPSNVFLIIRSNMAPLLVFTRTPSHLSTMASPMCIYTNDQGDATPLERSSMNTLADHPHLNVQRLCVIFRQFFKHVYNNSVETQKIMEKIK